MDKKICKKCGAVLKHYDRVVRIVKGKGGVKSYIHVERYRCPKCKTIHMIIDPLKARYNKINYVTDQLLHYIVMLV